MDRDLAVKLVEALDGIADSFEDIADSLETIATNTTPSDSGSGET